MTYNGVSHDFGCTMEGYLYTTYKEQAIFDRTNIVSIFEIVML